MLDSKFVEKFVEKYKYITNSQCQSNFVANFRLLDISHERLGAKSLQECKQVLVLVLNI
jgi:hypothetical protein